MRDDQLSNSEIWRALILFGKNEATYKLALGQCLSSFAEQGKTWIPQYELAQSFFDLYLLRVASGMPQLKTKGKKTKMETIIEQFQKGIFSRERAIEQVGKYAFGDVLPRFHILNDKTIPIRFYEHQKMGLNLTNNIFTVFAQSNQKRNMQEELDTKWTLLELGFEQRHKPTTPIIITNDTQQFYMNKGEKRISLTHLDPLLRGCQNNRCFYCEEELDNKAAVDHVIPFSIIGHNEIWNLVLAHKFCNELKSDRIASQAYFDKLYNRNEDIVKIKHPLEMESQILRDLGSTASQRLIKMRRQYNYAWERVQEPWIIRPGHHPESDPFFRKVVRALD
jgi:hypothetical protein